MNSDPDRTACSACGAPTDPGARYCGSCAAPLSSDASVSCLACGEMNPQSARFCQACGTPLGSVGEAERRIITVLFADLSGFTELTERLDAEEVRTLVADIVDRLSDCVTRWGGFVDKFIGDCVMALFGAPVAYENEEERAIRAALDMHAKLDEWEIPPGARVSGDYRPRLRIGINTGPVVTGVFSGGGTVDYTAVGDVVNVASRLQGLCDPGGILVGGSTFGATQHVFDYGDEQILRVKGRREPVRARKVLGLRTVRGQARGFGGASIELIGRQEELSALRSAWSRSRQRDALQVLLLVGPAGIGKSRLLEELLGVEGLEAGSVAMGRSYPYSTNTPWEPIAELLRGLHGLPAGLTPVESARRIASAGGGGWSADRLAALAVALGEPAGSTDLTHLGPADRLDSVRRAVSGALEAGIGASPHLLVLEDLHWADRSTLDYLTGLATDPPAAPSLLVLVSRPPLPRELHLAKLFEVVSDRVELSPLTGEQARSFLDALLGEHEIPEGLLSSIVDRAEGNPLFLEETLKSMAASGVLEKSNGGWRAQRELKDLDVPDTIESVLTTRIDRLEPSTRRVLQYAAIVGRRFWSGVLSDALASGPVERELETLVRGAFVRALPGSVVEEDREFLFEHLLLQEVAYESTLRGMRTELHGAVARWLEENLGGRVAESDEWIAHHYERSEEPERAIPFLERAARAARDRGALPDADSLVERALRLTASTEDAFRLLCLADDIAAFAGDRARRQEVVGELTALAGGGNGAPMGVEAAYRRARFLLEIGDLEEARSVARGALGEFGGTSEISRQDDLLSLLGRVAHLWGDYGEALESYTAALPLHRESGDRPGEAETLDRLGLVQVDLGHFHEGLEHFQQARRIYAELGLRPLEARVLSHRATALRALGRHEAAVEAAGEALALAEACGSRRALATAKATLGMALGSAGLPAEARERLSAATGLAAELGRRRLEARCWLARAEIESEDVAREAAERARELGGQSGLIHVEILALTRLAELDLEAGDAAAADGTSAEATDLLRRHGNIQGPEERVLHVRGHVLSALDRSEEARETFEQAAAIVREKADAIPDPEERQGYLGTGMNRVILEAAGPA